MGLKDGEEREFDVSHKIMLSAMGSIFGVMMIIILLRLYQRYRLRRQERRSREAALVYSQRAQTALIDAISINEPPAKSSGLDPLIVASLPKFTYKLPTGGSQADDDRDECSVCLGTIVEDCMVRVLPNCKHMFHVKCVDSWLGSHTTCPICRTVAEPTVQPDDKELGTGVQPTAPPTEENMSQGAAQVVKDGGSSSSSPSLASGSRFGSFRRMFGTERSIRRSQSCGNEIMPIQDIERIKKIVR